MSTASKRKGTDAEVKLLAWLHANAHPEAVRNNRPPAKRRRPAPVTPRSGPSYIRGGKGV